MPMVRSTRFCGKVAGRCSLLRTGNGKKQRKFGTWRGDGHLSHTPFSADKLKSQTPECLPSFGVNSLLASISSRVLSIQPAVLE